MTPTPSQTIGPFFGFALPFSDDAAAAPSGSPDTLRIEGQVLDGAGDPVPDALLEISENDQFARCRTDAEGAFHFIVRKPNEAFFSMTVFARGLLRHLNTRMYLPDAEDPVLSSAGRHAAARPWRCWSRWAKSRSWRPTCVARSTTESAAMS